MKYANTLIDSGVETVITVLPLDLVPGFDPENPPQENTYGVPDDVQVGWVKQGGVFVAPPPAPPAPPQITKVTALQGMLAIDSAGLSATFEAWANNPARTFAERAFIDKAQTWRRDDATLNAAATSFGLSASQVDNLFTLAKTL